MTDVIPAVIDLLTPWDGVAVWHGMLPKGFTNAAPAVVVTLDNDQHADSGGTRRADVSFRVYGGSGRAADARAIYRELMDRLTAANGGAVLRVGEIAGQELPLEPVTGWPACNVRAVVRVTER
jgi:hypothetical protein